MSLGVDFVINYKHHLDGFCPTELAAVGRVAKKERKSSEIASELRTRRPAKSCSDFPLIIIVTYLLCTLHPHTTDSYHL
jgi:hypothetical protein